MNFIFEVHLRRTTNPLGSRSNPEGSKIEPLWVRSRTQTGSKIEPLWVRVFEPRRVHVFEPFWVPSRTQKGSKNDEPSGFEIEPRGFEDRTPLGSISNPEGFEDRTPLGSISNPSGFVSSNPEGFMSSNPSGFHLEPRRVRRSNPSGFHLEPEGFDLRTLWVPRTQKGSKIEPSWVSNPSGFVEPRGFEDRTLWVRSRTQKGSKIRTLLGSWNPEGSKIEPSGFDLRTLLGSRSNPEGFEDTNPEAFDLRTRLGSRSNPEWFDLRTLWVRSRTQRGSIFEPFGFDLEPRGFVVLRR
ncbi:hypothetical protein ACOSQ2_027278 [Xanthoceras sorbifolium]